MQETCIDYVQGDDYCTFHAGAVWSRNLAKEWMRDHPNEVEVIHEYDDCIILKVPAQVIKYLRWPTKRAPMTEEHKEKLLSAAKRGRAKRAENLKNKKMMDEVTDEVMNNTETEE